MHGDRVVVRITRDEPFTRARPDRQRREGAVDEGESMRDAATREVWLSEKKGERVHVHVPERGEKVRLVEMAMENARQSFASRRDNARLVYRPEDFGAAVHFTSRGISVSSS